MDVRVKYLTKEISDGIVDGINHMNTKDIRGDFSVGHITVNFKIEFKPYAPHISALTIELKTPGGETITLRNHPPENTSIKTRAEFKQYLLSKKKDWITKLHDTIEYNQFSVDDIRKIVSRLNVFAQARYKIMEACGCVPFNKNGQNLSRYISRAINSTQPNSTSTPLTGYDIYFLTIKSIPIRGAYKQPEFYEMNVSGMYHLPDDNQDVTAITLNCSEIFRDVAHKLPVFIDKKALEKDISDIITEGYEPMKVEVELVKKDLLLGDEYKLTKEPLQQQDLPQRDS